MANLGDAPTTPLHQDNAAVAAALNLTGISPESNRILMAEKVLLEQGAVVSILTDNGPGCGVPCEP